MKQKQTFLGGTFLLTAASFIVKIFGFIYVIPFVAMVGESKYILFEYAYKPYIILLSVATLGIPNAVSKYVSKNRESGKSENIRALLYSGIPVITVLGTLAFLLLYFSSDVVASWLVDPSDKTGNSLEDVSYVIKMISFALIIVPLLAMTRGFMQGYQDMRPTAYSQIIEQIVRIAVILLGTYLIVYHFGGSEVKAVGLSTFSAFISAAVALVIVFYYLKKSNISLNFTKKKVSYLNIYKELIVYAIPFVFVGLAIPIFQSIDTFMINNVLMDKGLNLGAAESVNTLVALNQKIVVIPVALATAFSVSLVAYISNAHTGNRLEEIQDKINQSIRVLLFFILPSIIGMMILSKPIFTSVYGTQSADSGSQLLFWYSATALFYSMFSVTTAILQGLDKQKWVIVSLLIGIVIKLTSNYPLITWLEGEGTAVSTYLGFGAAIIFQMIVIQKSGVYRWASNSKEVFNIFLQTIVMGLIILPFYFISQHFENYLYQALILLVSIGLAGLSYLIVSYKNKTLFFILSKDKVARFTTKKQRP